MPRLSFDAAYARPQPTRINRAKRSIRWLAFRPFRLISQMVGIIGNFRSLSSIALGISAVVLIIMGFTGGALTVLNSRQSLAEQKQESSVAVSGEPLPLSFDETELNVVADFLPILIEENRHEPSEEEIKALERKDKLKKYLQSKRSPFAKSDKTLDAFLTSDNMKLMLAISFVESTMGQRCYYNNCSGIGGYPPNLRKYPSYAEWIVDFDKLLNRRYKGLPIEKFLGLYVQPGSPAWLAGVRQVLAELKSAGIE